MSPSEASPDIAWTRRVIAVLGSILFAALLVGSTPSGALAAPPPNDDFVNAQILTGSNVSVSGTMADSTLESAEPSFGSLATGTVWFSWTAPTSGHVRVGSGDHPMLLVAAFTGSTLGDLVKVGSGFFSVAFAAEAGTTYRLVLVTAHMPDAFTLTVAMVPPPPNDDFANAEILTGFPVTTKGTTSGATYEPGEPDHGDRKRFASVWYSWTAPSSGATRLDACPLSANETAAVYTGANFEDLTPVAGGSCRLNFTATAGVTYRIVISLTPGPESLTFDLRLRRYQPPANDSFANAQALSGSNVSVSGTMVDSTVERAEPHFGSAVSGTVWFSWTAPESGDAAIDVGSDYQFLVVAVYTGNTLGDLVPVGSGFNSFAFSAEAGTTYRIALATAYVEPDQYTVSLSLDAALPARHMVRVIKGGSGEGAVTSSPGGIDCGSKCSAEFDEGTVVTLTASPESGSTFTGWSGAGCSGTGTCHVTVGDDETVKANFATRSTRPGTAKRKAAIGKVRISGSRKIRRDRTVTYKVRVSNSGRAFATGVKLRVKGKGVKGRSHIGRIAPGRVKTVKVKLRFRKPGKVKLVFRVGSLNAGGKIARKTVIVRK